MTSLVLTRARTLGKNIHYYFLSRNLRKMPYRREERPLTRFQTRGRIVEHIQLNHPIKLRLTISKTASRQLHPISSVQRKGGRGRRRRRCNSDWDETEKLPESKLIFFEDPSCSSVECKLEVDDDEEGSECSLELKNDKCIQKCECPERSITDITDELSYVQMKGYFDWMTSFFKRWGRAPRRRRSCRRVRGGNRPRPLTST